MSAYASGKFKQDMPPPGGYSDIHYRRIPAQRLLGYKTAFFASTLMTCYGLYYYNKRHVFLQRIRVDYRDHIIPLEPLIYAEQDRAYLRQIRHNRNVERDLMKNVPDWKVGTLWGLPVYENLPKNAIPSVSLTEFYGHRDVGQTKDATNPNRDVGMEDMEYYT